MAAYRASALVAEGKNNINYMKAYTGERGIFHKKHSGFLRNIISLGDGGVLMN